MYEYIQGTLVQATTAYAIIDVQGVGYKLLIPTHLFAKLPQINAEIKLHVSFIIREFSQSLYGFLSLLERDLFEVLLNVSGIGPKLALSMVSSLSHEELYLAVTEKRIQILCKVPGIGKKTAERLIVELKDKLYHMPNIVSVDQPVQSKVDPHMQKIQDGMNALIHLGYTQLAAQKAIQKTLKDIPENSDLAELITQALKNV